MPDQYSAFCIDSFAAKCQCCTRLVPCFIRFGFDRHLANLSPFPESLFYVLGVDVIFCKNYKFNKIVTFEELSARKRKQGGSRV